MAIHDDIEIEGMIFESRALHDDPTESTKVEGRNELLSSDPSLEDAELDGNLRPLTFDEYVGQPKAKESLRITIEAAKRRNETIDHVLISGPPGLGKTTLAGVIAHELGANLRYTSGPALERTGDLAAILTNLEDGDVLFVDEIHRMNHVIEEVLYPALEDFTLDIIIGKGPAAQSIRLDLPRFTLVAATTRTGLLSGPLRDRFGLALRLDYYDEDDLSQILARSARILKIDATKEALLEIASRSRGTPRLANRMLKRVRDWAQVKNDGNVDRESSRQAMDFFEVDGIGLDGMDIRILKALCLQYDGRPVGLTTLATSVSEEPDTIEDVYEPYLMQRGLIVRTPKGRQATALAFDHLGIARSDSK